MTKKLALFSVLALLVTPIFAQTPMGGVTVAGGGGGGGSPSFVQAASSVSASSNPGTVALTVTAGHKLLVCAGAWNAATSFSISDGQTLTWTSLATNTDGASAGTGSACWLSTNTTASGSDTISFNPGVTTRNAIVAYEVSGVTAVDVTATSNNQTTATLTVGPSAATTSANELVAAFAYAYNQSAIVFTAGTGYTLPTGASLDGSANSAAMIYKTVSTTGTQTATYTVSSQTGDPVQLILVTLK